MLHPGQTGQRQVISYCLSTMLAGNEVINLVRFWCVVLMDEAVLTALTGPFHDVLA